LASSAAQLSVFELLKEPENCSSWKGLNTVIGIFINDNAANYTLVENAMQYA
jgi:hypothetical protein